jgi:alkylation response protein AidB-like acyl-CoA dehydrogenase
MNQISHLESHFTKQARKPTDNVWESMGLDAVIRPEVAEKRKKTAEMMKSVDLRDNVNNATMPFWMVPKI